MNINNTNNNNDLILINENCDDQQQQKLNEILFWKVFHNKYIRNCIMDQIGSSELPYHMVNDKSIKFKDLTNLGWFIKYNQFSLLKCKLEAREYIEFDNDEIIQLFEKIGKEHYNNNDNIDEDEDFNFIVVVKNYFCEKRKYFKGDEFINDSNQNQESIDYQFSNAKQSLELLVRNYPCIIAQTLFDCCIYSNWIHLKYYLFIDQNFSSIIITEDIIKKLVISSSLSFFDQVISNLKKTKQFNTIITDNIKNNIISWVSNSQCYTEEKLEYILNDNQLYNIPSIYDSNKRLKLQSNQFENSYIHISNHHQHQQQQQQQQYNTNIVCKLDLILFLKMKSSTIQERLLNLNYINGTDIPIEIKNDMVELLDNNNNNNGNHETRIKSLFKLIAIFDNRPFNTTYLEYLIKYDDPIDGLQDGLVLKHSIISKSVNGLKYLLSKDKDTLEKVISLLKPNDFYYSFHGSQLITKFEFSNEHIEFIKLYTTGYHWFKFASGHHDRLESNILKFIFSIKSNQEYEILSKSIIRTIENKSFTDIIPEQCSPISLLSMLHNTYNQVIIQDTDTIDLIIKNSNYIQLFYCFKEKYNRFFDPNRVFKFCNYKLIEYLKSNYGIGSDNQIIKYSVLKELTIGSQILKLAQPEELICRFPFTLAINNCDIESLKEIDSQNIKLHRFEIDFSIHEIKYSKHVLEKIKEIQNFKNTNEYYKHQTIKDFVSDEGGGIEYRYSPDNSETKREDHPILSTINFNYQNKNNGIGIEKINEVLEYFNSSGYKSFSKQLFKWFINDISKLSNTIELSKLKISFQQFQTTSIELIFDSISFDLNPNTIQLVLNNIDPFSLPVELTNPVIIEWENSIDSFKETSYFKYNVYIGEEECFKQMSIIHQTYEGENINGPYCSYSYQSSNEIIQCIKILLKHFKTNYNFGYANNNNNNTINNNNNNNNNYHNIIFQKIINYLFIRLIKVYKVDISEIKQTYQFIQSIWLSITGGIEFQFEHSLYHVFFYLGIRSMKLMNYLIGQLNESLENSFDPYHRICDFTRDDGDLCISFGPSIKVKRFYQSKTVIIPFYPLNVLDSNLQIFSFDFIFNAPLNEIFKKLINLEDE